LSASNERAAERSTFSSNFQQRRKHIFPTKQKAVLKEAEALLLQLKQRLSSILESAAERGYFGRTPGCTLRCT
jgi:hypothetical protein